MKKIAFYIECLIIGGAERVLIDLVNLLDPSKYDITVISIFKESVYPNYNLRFEDPFFPHVKYKWLVDNTKSLKYNLFNYLFAHGNQARLYKLLVKETYDVEIAFYEGLPTEFVAYSNNKKSKKYVWLHTDNRKIWEDLPNKKLDELHFQYKQYDQVIGVSNAAVNSFGHFFSDIRTKTIYSPVNYELIEKKAQVSVNINRVYAPLFLTVGRLIPVKGYARLLRSLEQLSVEGYEFQLIMIGTGEEEDELKQYVKEHNLKDRVMFLGSQQNPYAYMKMADYLICSSVVEGMGLALIEAMICELPILATDCGGPKEIFGDYECGIITENTEEGIYTMIKNTLIHPEKRNIYQSECRKRREYFNTSQRMKDFELLLED